MIGIVNRLLGKVGYRIAKTAQPLPFDLVGDKSFMEAYEKCKPFTMTSIERMYALHQAVLYVINNNIPGDFVECGVWRGGSSMMISLTLLQAGISDRKIYLYDTFEGMSEPGEEDKSFDGTPAENQLAAQSKEDEASVWCYSSLDSVQANLASTGYPNQNLVFIKGKVEDTLPLQKPTTISLLRLDTDWYESTKQELEHLYPLLSKRGPLIIDDFGHWEGAKSAVIEYFNKNDITSYLGRLDYTGRMMIKE